MAEKLAKRQPLAFGAQQWALPGTESTLLWGGPGDPLLFGHGRNFLRVRHPAADRTYDTVKAADRAAQALAAAYMALVAEEEGDDA